VAARAVLIQWTAASGAWREETAAMADAVVVAVAVTAVEELAANG
jgi:hypothetical protein